MHHYTTAAQEQAQKSHEQDILQKHLQITGCMPQIF